jgi:hypothetical protein
MLLEPGIPPHPDMGVACITPDARAEHRGMGYAARSSASFSRRRAMMISWVIGLLT